MADCESRIAIKIPSIIDEFAVQRRRACSGGVFPQSLADSASSPVVFELNHMRLICRGARNHLNQSVLSVPCIGPTTVGLKISVEVVSKNLRRLGHEDVTGRWRWLAGIRVPGEAGGYGDRFIDG